MSSIDAIEEKSAEARKQLLRETKFETLLEVFRVTPTVERRNEYRNEILHRYNSTVDIVMLFFEKNPQLADKCARKYQEIYGEH